MVNFRNFSLSCPTYTSGYDQSVLPLLKRMPNLEKLHLYLLVCGRETFIDGNDMKVNIVNSMPYLNKFTFNIYSFIRFNHQSNLLSNGDLQKTFNNFINDEVLSCVDYFPKATLGQCHVYSYPFQLEYFDSITNSFSFGKFNYVRRIVLFDERPFEHEFFMKISQSFPVLEQLAVKNRRAQRHKLLRKGNNSNGNLAIIEYPCLIELDLTAVHLDYVKQFMFDTKTCLPTSVCLLVNYKLLKKATRNFRRNATKNNCAKLRNVLFL